MTKIYRVKNKISDIEPHEVFLDKLAKEKEEELEISEKKFEVPIRERISYILFGIFLLLALVLFSKTFYLQAIKGKELRTVAENNGGSFGMIIPERGVIYDKNFKKLVSNSPAFDLVCLPVGRQTTELGLSSEEISKEIQNIAQTLAIDPVVLMDKIQFSDSSEILLAENLEHKNILLLETKINDFKGCRIQQNTKRDYIHSYAFSHVLGYEGRINKDEYSNSKGYAINDYIGKVGLEKYYETYLRGTPGRSVPNKDEVALAAEPGNNLILNIDADLQLKVYDALEKSIKNVGAKKGAAVALNPKNGAVLALVSYPSFDSNIFSTGISKQDYDKLQNDLSQPFFNRAIQAQYPTGSTIKPFEASAALQEKLISPDKLINDPGYILVKSRNDPSVVYKYGGVAPHGLVDMKKALAVSSNIYFYTVGGGYGDQQGLGPARIKKYLSLFGWDQKTGIDLPGEFEGFIPSPEWKKQVKKEGWWDGDTYNLSIGQSDLQTTPLQVALAYSVIANNGTLYKPQIVSKIIEGSGKDAKVIKEFSPEIIRSDLIDPKNLEIVKEGMRDGVTKPYGLSTYLNDLPVSVAAKTGTAEIGYQNQFNVWSSVFAPYENPEIVLVVTVENVQGFGAVTLPVAHDVLQWYFSK